MLQLSKWRRQRGPQSPKVELERGIQVRFYIWSLFKNDLPSPVAKKDDPKMDFFPPSKRCQGFISDCENPFLALGRNVAKVSSMCVSASVCAAKM